MPERKKDCDAFFLSVPLCVSVCCVRVCVSVCVCVCLSVYVLIKAQSRRSLETAKLFEIICTESLSHIWSMALWSVTFPVQCTSLNRFDFMQTNRTRIFQMWMREDSHHVAC